MNYYSGIGARITPEHIKVFMNLVSHKLYEDNYILRSGGAKGADKAFEIGIDKKEIFRPEHCPQYCIDYASKFHPHWDKCNKYVKKLHGRNAQIILGKYLDEPSKFVICWTVDGKIEGGTGLAIRIAQENKIPVFNLSDEKTLKRLCSYLKMDITDINSLSWDKLKSPSF